VVLKNSFGPVYTHQIYLGNGCNITYAKLNKQFVETSAQLPPAGTYIVTASDDGTARIYLVRIQDLIALAKTRVTRELTCQERRLYLHEDVSCEEEN
jgi:WD40 repeat protein